MRILNFKLRHFNQPSYSYCTRTLSDLIVGARTFEMQVSELSVRYIWSANKTTEGRHSCIFFTSDSWQPGTLRVVANLFRSWCVRVRWYNYWQIHNTLMNNWRVINELRHVAEGFWGDTIRSLGSDVEIIPDLKSCVADSSIYLFLNKYWRWSSLLRAR